MQETAHTFIILYSNILTFNIVAILNFVFKTSKCTHVLFMQCVKLYGLGLLSMIFMRDVLKHIHQQSARIHNNVPPQTRPSSKIPCILELCSLKLMEPGCTTKKRIYVYMCIVDHGSHGDTFFNSLQGRMQSSPKPRPLKQMGCV